MCWCPSDHALVARISVGYMSEGAGEMSRGERLAVAARLAASGYERGADAIRAGRITTELSSTGEMVTVNSLVAAPDELLVDAVNAEHVLVEAIKASFPGNWEVGIDVYVQFTALDDEHQSATDVEETDIEDPLEAARLRYRHPGQLLLQRLGSANVQRLVTVIESGLAPAALTVAARWWQLESYLRQLVYIELRAKYGPDWRLHLAPRVTNRAAETASQFSYMASADDDHLLAHLDVSALFDLISTHWSECQHGIGLPETTWAGRVFELKAIRHRMAHGRRPHADDTNRIEQTLRDLEPGAHRALHSYVDYQVVRGDLDDPVVADWCHGGHELSQLIEHGHDRRGIHFDLCLSRRPWADGRTRPITGSPGFYWIMHVVLDRSRIYLDDYYAESGVRVTMPMIGHIVEPDPRSLLVTFPAVGDPIEISDSIGRCFEAVFAASRPIGPTEDEDWRPWRLHNRFDSRLDGAGMLSVLSGLDSSQPITLFEA